MAGFEPPPAESDAVSLEIRIRLPLDRFELDLELDLDSPATGIFGPSGAGKTSLIETLAGWRRGAAGRIRFQGRTWLDSEDGIFVPPEHRGIGWAAQDGLLFPHWDVRHNLLAGAARARRAGQDTTARLDQVAELLDLTPLLGRDVTTLSGGERQRVALGRALCSGPRLLLLDEPFAALDLERRRRFLPFLRRVRQELTVPMLLISHDPVEVQALCDDLVVLHDGRTAAQGPPQDVLTDPKIFAMADRAGFENVLRGRLEGDGAAPRRLLLAPRKGQGNGPELVTEGRSGGGPALVGLRANDILLATAPPVGLSARNLLPATIDEIREDQGLVAVTLVDSDARLFVQVTEHTAERLGLALGSPVYLVFKATACRVYGSIDWSVTRQCRSRTRGHIPSTLHDPVAIQPTKDSPCPIPPPSLRRPCASGPASLPPVCS